MLKKYFKQISKEQLIMDEKKTFLIPTLEIVVFANKDILTVSGIGEGNADWTQDDNYEPFPLN